MKFRGISSFTYFFSKKYILNIYYMPNTGGGFRGKIINRNPDHPFSHWLSKRKQ